MTKDNEVQNEQKQSRSDMIATLRSMEATLAQAKKEHTEAWNNLERHYDIELRKTRNERANAIKPWKQKTNQSKAQLQQDFQDRLKQAERTKQEAIKQAEAQYIQQKIQISIRNREKLDEIQQGFNKKAQNLANEYQNALTRVEKERDEALAKLEQEHNEQIGHLQPQIEALKANIQDTGKKGRQAKKAKQGKKEQTQPAHQ